MKTDEKAIHAHLAKIRFIATESERKAFHKGDVETGQNMNMILKEVKDADELLRTMQREDAQK